MTKIVNVSNSQVCAEIVFKTTSSSLNITLKKIDKACFSYYAGYSDSKS